MQIDINKISTSQVISKFAGFINQDQRENNIEIIIDGVKSNINDIYIDLRKYDINNDGKIDDTELTIIQEFIQNFDIDGDGQVTSKDINTITEEFYNESYNINYDILNKGKLDQENLVIIKQLYSALDINYDNIINQFEIDEIIQMIYLFKNFDFNNDLCIDFVDLNNIIKYILENENKTWDSLFNETKQFIMNNILSKELQDFIFEIINSDLENFKSAIEYFLKTNNIELNNETLILLYQFLNNLLDFQKYDLNHDGILDKKDIELMTNKIYENTDHKITYYISSNITIHMNDHTLNNDSITDIVDYSIK